MVVVFDRKLALRSRRPSTESKSGEHGKSAGRGAGKKQALGVPAPLFLPAILLQVDLNFARRIRLTHSMPWPIKHNDPAMRLERASCTVIATSL